jgi:hypothetical protein
MHRLALVFFAALLPAAGPGAPVRFRNVAGAAGVRFTLDNAPMPEKRMIETMAGGLAVFDYNNDGRPDIFFTNGAAGLDMNKQAPKYWNRLFRNDGGWKFTDVTAEAGVAGKGGRFRQRRPRGSFCRQRRRQHALPQSGQRQVPGHHRRVRYSR